MGRALSLVVALSLAVGIGVVGAQSSNGSAPKPYVIAGVVRGVSSTSLTLEIADRGIVVIGADAATRVIGRGWRRISSCGNGGPNSPMSSRLAIE
jgi:hypothetical protein